MSSVDISKIFVTDLVRSPLCYHAIAERRENNFHDQFCHCARQGAVYALDGSPMESVPENGRETHEYDKRENKVI